MGRWEEALDDLEQVFDYYLKEGNINGAVEIALCSLPDHSWRHGIFPMVESALKIVQPDSYQAGQLLSRYGVLLFVVDQEYAKAQDAFNKAIAIARRENDAYLEMWTWERAAAQERDLLRWDEMLQKALNALELAPRAKNLRAESTAHFHAATALLHLGDIGRARFHAVGALSAAEILRERFRCDNAISMNMDVAWMEGDWNAFRQRAEQLMAVPPKHPAPSLLILTECQTGNYERARDFLDEWAKVWYVSSYPYPSAWRTAYVVPMAAYISGERELLDVAEQAARNVLAESHSSPNDLLCAMSGLPLSLS